MTFELSKALPVHSWFWYKEGYAPQLVEYSIERFVQNRKLETVNRKPALILDPFCGVGTTLLAAKQKGIASIGIDASPLAVFVSKTKTQNYEKSDLESALAFLTKKIKPAPGSLRWDFELFDARAAFPKRNYNEILALREEIEQVEGNARDLLLLALLSILPQASIILKDGGVLKIDKRKRALPAREIFRRRVKAMVRDLESSSIAGPKPEVFLGDARALDLNDSSVDLVVTSPPYLNNIDYSKIYGLELSLLEMSKSAAEQMRMRAIRSFIRTGNRKLGTGNRQPETAMPQEVGDIGYRIPIIGTYFKDMEAAMKEMFRVLRPGGEAHINVSNSVIYETHVLVDEVFAEMG